MSPSYPTIRPRPHEKIFYVILNGVVHYLINTFHSVSVLALNKKMTEYIIELHTAIFTGQTRCGKTHLVLDLIENHYNKHFDYIVIICPTLRINKT